MPDDPNTFSLEKMTIRTAREVEYSIVRQLFVESLLEGQVSDNDTGADMEHITETYFSDDGRSCLWIGEYDDDIIAMVAVLSMSDDVAEVRRLRVSPNFRRQGVGTKMMEQAIAFCQRLGYLKVLLDVRIERGPAIAMFEKFGFQLNRVREKDSRKLLDFYLDLYRDPNI